MYSYVLEMSVLFSVIPIRTRTAPVARNTREFGRERPSGHSRRGLGAMRAVCRARRALKVFFFRREWTCKTISRAFFLRRYSVPRIIVQLPELFGVFGSCGSLLKRRSFPQLWVPCAATGLGHIYHQSLGALRALCRVSRARVRRGAI